MAANKSTTPSFKKISLAFEALAIRERRLIFWALPVLILFVGILVFIEPVIVEIGKIDQRIERSENQIASLEDTREALFIEVKKDPNESTKADIQRLEKRLAALVDEFQSELGQLVSPQVMPVLLEKLFENADSLTLLKMESIPPKALYTDESDINKLYQHGIRITFEGGYLQTRDFLAKAESLGWKLYWNHLQYEVSQYPMATTELELFTLSTSEAFIGVY